MGNSKSLDLAPAEGETATSSLGHVWLEFVQGNYVPGPSSGFSCAASNSKSDPFVMAWLESRDGDIKSSKVKSQICKTTSTPIWKSARRLDVWPAPQPDDVLVVELMDASPVASNKKTGDARIQLVDVLKEPTKFKPTIASGYDSNHMQDCTITIRRLETQQEDLVRIFLIRHAQSAWNLAQAEKDIGGMMNKDHPLTLEGIQQAQSLNARWRQEARSPARSEVVDGFLSATRVFSSPLTRAAQTAVVGLHGHKALKERGITLNRILREVKNPGGADCVATKMGDDIASRVERKLSETLEDPRHAKSLMCQFDAADANSQWWDTILARESRDEVRKRIREWLLALYQTGEGDGAIFVGHSLFFKSLFEMFSGSLKQNNPTLYKDATTKKLMNCGCIMLELDFSEINPQIVRSELMFGSEWETEGGAHKEESPPLTPMKEPSSPSLRLSLNSNRLSLSDSPGGSRLAAEWDSEMDYNYNESTPKGSPRGEECPVLHV